MDEPKLPAFFIPGFSLQKGSSFPAFPHKRPEKNDKFPLRNVSTLPLWVRLLAWCDYSHWYGPDEYEQSIGPYLDMDGVLHTARPLYEVQTGFAFPPATEKQIAQAEEAMGFVHPPLLRDLYQHVANGGFGPGKGLTGVPGGYDYWVTRDPRYDGMQEVFASRWEVQINAGSAKTSDFQPFDLGLHEQDSPQAELIRLSGREWPRHFLHLCAGDYEEAFYVHAKSGFVYLVGAGSGETLQGERTVFHLYRQATSLEDWFERWLAGEFCSHYPRV